MKTQTKNPAQNVISAFPTFKQLLSDPAYKAQIFEDKSTRLFINMAIDGSELACADMVAQLVNHMVRSLTEKPFYVTYNMSRAQDTSIVLDAYEIINQVNRDEFQALLKTFWFSYLSIKMSDAEFEAYVAFKSIPKIYRIMD